MLVATRQDFAKKAAAAKADAFIKKLDGMIEDDMNKYRNQHMKDKYIWPAETNLRLWRRFPTVLTDLFVLYL